MGRSLRVKWSENSFGDIETAGQTWRLPTNRNLLSFPVDPESERVREKERERKRERERGRMRKRKRETK